MGNVRGKRRHDAEETAHASDTSARAEGLAGAQAALTTRSPGLHLRELFAWDPGRGERMTAEAAGLYLDYSKNRITDETLRLLVALAAGVRRGRAPGRHVPR